MCAFAKAQHVELGKVKWMRSYEEAIEASKKFKKPILILFQEVPGCATCKDYGKNALSNDFIVAAIENEFIPLCIFNNKGGEDGKILAKYGEPTWNNPVVRIVNEKGIDIVDRLSSNYSVDGLASLMTLALRDKTPEYLRVFMDGLQLERGEFEEAIFSMYCFWSGEVKLGQIEGVLQTEAGFMNREEVVRVRYDKERISLRELSERAKENACLWNAYTDREEDHKYLKAAREVRKMSNFRLDKEDKYYLRQTEFFNRSMTPVQATKANALLGQGKSCESVFPPS